MSQASIRVDKKNVAGPVSRRFYGGLMEVLGDVFAGGLRAEVLRNRKFANLTDIEGWGTPMGWEPVTPPAERRKLQYITSFQSKTPGAWSVCLFGCTPNEERGICQKELAVEGGKDYVLTFYFRRAGGTTHDVSAAFADAYGFERLTPQQIGDADAKGWKKYECRFTFPRTTTSGELRILSRDSGTAFINCPSLLPADHFEGLREDMVQKLDQMGLKLLRFPGGCASECYDWRLGIGPKDFRRPWLNPAWLDWDSMDTGTDEICRLAERLGAEVHFTLNVTTLTEKEAAQWVEYCNGDAGTEWGQKRAANGHPAPYGVKLWGLANEANMFGLPCECTPGEYVDICNRFIRAMRAVDPTIEFVAIGNEPRPNPGMPDWNPTLFSKIEEPYEYHSVHLYSATPTPKDIRSWGMSTDQGALACVAVSAHIDRELQRIAADLKAQFPKNFPLPRVYFEEWGLISATVDWDSDPAELSDFYNLRGGLFTASVFNALVRQADSIGAGNVVFPTGLEFIFRHGNDVHYLPSAAAMELHQRFSGTTSYRPVVDSPTCDVPAMGPFGALANVAYLDVAATVDEGKKRLALFVVNRHPEQSIEASIVLDGFSPRDSIHGYRIATVDGFGDISDWYEKPDSNAMGNRGRQTVTAVWGEPKLRKVPHAAIEEFDAGTANATHSHVFPAHSFTVLVFPLAG